MKQQWGILSDRFKNVTQREKWLITLLGLVFISVSLVWLLLEPAYLKVQESKRNIELVQLNINNLRGETFSLENKLAVDPDKDLNARYEQQLIYSQQLSEQLSKINSSFMSPAEMASMLERVLGQSKNLTLVSLRSGNAEPLINEAEQNTNDNNARYFIHPVRIELTGRYFDIVKYLESLEAMPVKYFWRTFSYEVEEYPSARLIIEVYTLGNRKEFIGG